MGKKMVYTEEQANTMKVLLDGISTTGVQNAKKIACIAQILESGKPAEIKDDDVKKEGDG